MPKSSWAPPKAMRGKCERGHGSVNAGAEVQTQTGRVRKPSRAMGTRRGRLSAPWPRFHGVDRADVYIIIHVRACCCGECALNSPTSPPIPRRRPPLAPTQRRRPPRALPLPPRTLPLPRPATMHSPPKTFAPPAAQTPARRPHNPFPAEGRRPSPQRHAASPSVPLRAQKNGTAQCMCDAECFGRPSLRSVIWVGEPRAVRRRCGALACRRGA